MKFEYSLISLLALGSAAAPLEARNAAAINAGAIALIEGLEGFEANFYYTNGHQSIGGYLLLHKRASN
jgi:hypothetical protein